MKVQMVMGREAMLWAKMTGRTPDMFTFMGRVLLWPPYILRPTTFFAYCTGMRRSALVMTMITAISTRNTTTISGTNT